MAGSSSEESTLIGESNVPSSEEEDPSPQLSISVENVEHDETLRDSVTLLVHEYGIFQQVVPEIYALVPDFSKWRLTISGNLAATVNRLEDRDAETPYTTNRDAGHVGGVTLPQPDGTFDIILSAQTLVNPPGEFNDIDALVTAALQTGRHLGRHEAGHILLRLRGEDGDAYKGMTAGLSLAAVGWADVIAAYMDDFRIERHTQKNTPPAFTHIDGLDDALNHVSSELTASSDNWQDGIESAIQLSDKALTGFIRVMSYLSAELGTDEKGAAIIPTPEPAKWFRYAGTAWPLWSETFQKLTPVDESMEVKELARILRELCDLAANWSKTVGYDRGALADGRQYAFWTESDY